MSKYAHGVALIERVIKKVRAEGFGILGGCNQDELDHPQPLAPEVLQKLTFPGGQPLSPSLKHWLAFDTGWLGWFERPEPLLQPLSLGDYATKEFDGPWGGIYASVGRQLLTGACYGLPGGAEARRFLYVGQPDTMGEYPVLMIDIHNLPYIAIEYPGFDLYLAVKAGLMDEDEVMDAAHLIYGWRYREQAALNLSGRLEFELGSEVWFDEHGQIQM